MQIHKIINSLFSALKTNFPKHKVEFINSFENHPLTSTSGEILIRFNNSTLTQNQAPNFISQKHTLYFEIFLLTRTLDTPISSLKTLDDTIDFITGLQFNPQDDFLYISNISLLKNQKNVWAFKIEASYRYTLTSKVNLILPPS